MPTCCPNWAKPHYRVVRADEALPFAAITVGASLVRVDDGITPVDGIAALLRYAPSDAITRRLTAPVAGAVATTKAVRRQGE